MDTSFCNTAQKTVIRTLPGPLFVAAGAGSGKTFTLKLRTANAFLGTPEGFKLDSIDQVLAITFTEKAAAELLERIRTTLADEGFQEQAFAADAAWISTIHGFCSRFLHENALEIGLDPEFRLMTELEEEELTAQAQEAVLAQVSSGELNVRIPESTQPLVRVGEHGRGLMDDAREIINRASALPEGLAAFHSLEPDVHPKDDLSRLRLCAEEVLQAVGAWEKAPHKKNEAPVLEKLSESVAVSDAWLACDQAALSFMDDGFDASGYRAALKAFPVLTPAFGKGKGTDEVLQGYRLAHAKALSELEAALGAQVAEGVFRLAQAFDGEYSRLKHEAGVVDNDDLLRLTLEALRAHPHLAARCREQFRLIMVDEFQDTNKVQIEIIRLIAQPDMANVCVVGDAQQSIYRFRGADVAAFTEYRDRLAAAFPDLKEDQLQPKLAENFRSHGDILAFVDAVFSQEGSFGDEYLKLAPRGAIDKEPDAVMDGLPRVSVDVAHYKRGEELQRLVPEEAARRIARHFARIKRAYDKVPDAPRQSFALLLGTTGNAQIYIDALRAEGLESMMTAGSILLGTPEAKTMQALLRLALNRADEQALLDCLTSSLFAVSDDALLALSHFRGEDGGLHHGSLAKGFFSGNSLEEFGLAPEQAEPVECARIVLRRFVRDARSGALSRGVRRVLVASGALDRAQAAGVAGLASVGNWSKLMGILETVEQGGLASRVAAFEAKVQLMKESPGVLSAEEADFVQIMTIHGSKGLEFDHVAVAEFKTGAENAPLFYAENDGDALYALSARGFSLPKGIEGPLAALAEEARISRPQDAKTPGQLRFALAQTVRQEMLAEARRLFYVGLTRAVRSLYVSYGANKAPAPKGKEPYSNHGVMREVYQALQWDVEAKGFDEKNMHGYGGSRPARVVFHRYEALEDLEPQDGGEADAAGPGEPSAVSSAGADFLIPVRSLPEMPHLASSSGVRADVCSYTSLSKEFAHEPESAEQPKRDAPSNAPEEHEPAHVFGEDATSLGTAFHRLAQKAILLRNASGAHGLTMPSAAEMEVQAEKLKLTESQRARLEQALRAWFASPIARELASYEQVDAEVPFMVTFMDPEGRTRYLEGEMDALGVRGDTAFLVDYKTGGYAGETPEELHEKHLLQARCYAYALQQAGYASVKAVFVRVEQLDAHGAPQTVAYSFPE